MKTQQYIFYMLLQNHHLHFSQKVREFMLFFYKSPFIFLLCSYEKLKFYIFKYFFQVLKKPWVIANNFSLLFNRTATNFWFEYLLIFLLLLHKMAIDFHGKLRHFFIKEIHNAWTIRRIPNHDSRIPNFTMWHGLAIWYFFCARTYFRTTVCNY